MGTKKAPFYRVVVADSRNARGGKAIEEIGFYNPISVPKVVNIDAEKATEWLNKGAQPTEVVARLFDKAGIKK